jgi:hypothetical protein
MAQSMGWPLIGGRGTENVQKYQNSIREKTKKFSTTISGSNETPTKHIKNNL